MKVIYSILILILFWGINSIHAQVNSFEWYSPVDKIDAKISKILTLEEGNVVIFKPLSSSVRMDFSSYNGKQSKRNIHFKGKFNSVKKIGNTIVLFYTIYDSKSKSNQLFAKIITVGGEKEILLSQQTLVGNLHNKFKVEVSPNGNRILVLTEKPHKKGKKEMVVFTVYNENYKQLRTKTYLMNAIYSQKRKINVPIVNNNGDVYLLKRYRAQTQSKYYIISYNSLGNVNLKEFKLNYKPIKDAQFNLDEEGDLIVGGTFTSPNSLRAEGCYIAKFDAGANTIYRKEYSFRPETMLKFTTEKALKKNGLGLYGFRTNFIVIQKENISLILEHKKSKANSKTGINKEIVDGIIICAFDYKGNFIWDRPLRFNQTDLTEKGYWNSFICFNDTTHNNLSIIYNEVGFFDKKADNNFGENVAVGARMIVVDNQGNYKIQPVKDSFKGAPLDLLFNAKITKQVGDKLYLLAEPLDKSKYLLGVANCN